MRPRAPDTQALQQWMQMWQEIFRMWMGYMAPFTPGTPGASPFAPNGFGIGSPFGAYGARGAGEALEIEIETSQRVSVSLHLTDQSDNGMLRAQLHREEGDGRLALEFDPAAIRIALPDQQPAGTYSGVVRDGTGHQCGMMTIVVYDSAHRGA